MSEGNKQQATPQEPQATKAQHGVRSEVNWEGGSGRQPYANQEQLPEDDPARGTGFSEGDRGELSGRNREQLEEVTKKP